MKPNPFSSLNHFTMPDCRSAISTRSHHMIGWTWGTPNEVAVATVIATIQGIAAEGSKKTVPLILAALGGASLIMWSIGVRGKARQR